MLNDTQIQNSKVARLDRHGQRGRMGLAPLFSGWAKNISERIKANQPSIWFSPCFDCRKPISQCGVEELQVERRRTQRTAPILSSTRVSWSGGTFLVGEFSSSTVVSSGLLNPGIRMFKERRLGWFAKEGRLSSLLLPAPPATSLTRKPQLRRRSWRSCIINHDFSLRIIQHHIFRCPTAWTPHERTCYWVSFSRYQRSLTFSGGRGDLKLARWAHLLPNPIKECKTCDNSLLRGEPESQSSVKARM